MHSYDETKTKLTFPVGPGIHGMNDIALFLNNEGLVGQWHFGAGSTCYLTQVDIDFDESQDAAKAWRDYGASSHLAPSKPVV